MKCRVCKCTWEHACDGGCTWAAPGICSTCATMVEMLRNYSEVARSFSATALIAEMKHGPRNYRDVARGFIRKAARSAS